MRPPFLPFLLVARLASAAPATLEVDLTDAPRGVFHAVETLPAGPGPLTLVLPRWIPGEHGPTGPIGDLAGLVFSVDGRTLPWTRDPVDLFAFRVDVPAGASSLTARFDYLAAGSNGEYVDGPCATPNLAILSWNHVVLAPAGVRQDSFVVAPRVLLPPGWRYGTALVAAADAQSAVTFAPVTLERLVDSPLTCGRWTRTIPLAGELSPPHRAFLVADSERALAAPADLVAQWADVVREARAFFGAPHYGSYTFLVTLSDAITPFGLEHHESSDNRMSERALIESGGRAANALLLSHEFAHSWNGKYRRPAAMNPPDFQAPLQTDLLWVYEGLTEYAGWVIGARAHTRDEAAARDELARNAAVLAARPGRRWRPLIDTAVAASLLNTAPGAFSSWRRGQDYYGEGALIWLEADVLIRTRTRGKRALDDWTRAFFGGTVPGPPAVVPYTRADVVRTLNAVAPLDWEGFFAARVDSVRTQPPLAGLEAAGWQLGWRDSSSDYMDALDAEAEQSDYRFSLGFRVGDAGTLGDVIPDSPAARAGLAPGAKLIAVEGRTWSRQALDDALDATRPVVAAPDSAAAAGPRGRDGIEVIASSDGFVRTCRIAYTGGPRKPVLRRRSGTPDLLARITAPHEKRRK
jgi:predicted metalloprotease with PDZ domain